LTLVWVDDRTLVVKAHIHRPAIKPNEEEEKDSGAENVVVEDKFKQKEIKPTEAEGKATPVSVEDNPVHLITGGRRIGNLVQSFYFNVDVSHNTLEASISHGLLRIFLEKISHAQKEAKMVVIKHGDR
jgi:hypothetical protein